MSEGKSRREYIRDAQDRAEELITVAEWGGDFLLLELDGTMRGQILTEAADAKGHINLSRVFPQLVIGCLCDPETREPVFGEEDLAWLPGKSGSVLERIGFAAAGLSKLTAQAEGEAAKN